eukprot:2513916-Rhodomonas_salina.1
MAAAQRWLEESETPPISTAGTAYSVPADCEPASAPARARDLQAKPHARLGYQAHHTLDDFEAHRVCSKLATICHPTDWS